MDNSGKDKWIAWEPGRMFAPVSGCTLVDVMYGDGEEARGIPAGKVIWEVGKCLEEQDKVIQYRIHKQHGWNGEGLPPIGCECEVNDERTDSWSLVDSVLAHACVYGRDVAVFQIADYIAFSPADRFRCIRPEAERKRDETVDVICDLLEIDRQCGARTNLEMIYNWIESGRIPGLRLSDD